jgi:hypothetical protein
MSFSLREKVAEGRMRGGRFHFAVRPLILSFSRGEKGLAAGFFS